MLLPPLGQRGGEESRFTSNLKAPNVQDLGNPYFLRVISFFKTWTPASLRLSSIYFSKPLIYSMRIREEESVGEKTQRILIIHPWQAHQEGPQQISHPGHLPQISSRGIKSASSTLCRITLVRIKELTTSHCNVFAARQSRREEDWDMARDLHIWCQGESVCAGTTACCVRGIEISVFS